MRFFNTSGPCEPARHYMLPARERLPEAPRLIDQGQYFIVHAPRQSGKTTTLRALCEALTAEGRYAALYISCKSAEASAGDLQLSQLAILHELQQRADEVLPSELQPPSSWPAAPSLKLLSAALRAWAKTCPRPLVLVFDEIDTLYGDALRSVLAQLHAGFPERPSSAPWSVILCGLRNIRDYREAAGKDPGRFGSASPFNIAVKSFRLPNFTAAEVATLYAQHTADTGQLFTPAAQSRAHEVTGGQPWLVNAIAREIREEMAITGPIDASHVQQASERLILARSTHIDSLLARLTETRVQQVIEPILAGAPRISSRLDDDLEYVRDLGLLLPEGPVKIANPIYQEVIVRALGQPIERDLQLESRAFILPDGRLDLRRLLEEFAVFFREHGEILESDLVYHEVAPQLVLMAFLQRVVNGGGSVTREYGLGKDRIDLHVRWPYLDAAGRRCFQSLALELKVWRDKKADPLIAGLVQLEQYLVRLELPEGALVIFDRRSEGPPLPERIAFQTAATASGRPVLVLRA